VCQILQASDPGQWPKWRGPDDNGMARGDAGATPKLSSGKPPSPDAATRRPCSGATGFPHHPDPHRSSQGRRANPGAQPEHRYNALTGAPYYRMARLPKPYSF